MVLKNPPYLFKPKIHDKPSHQGEYSWNSTWKEVWWSGCSRNHVSNKVFKCIHQLVTSAKCTVLTRYVPSKDNSADDLSYRIYPSTSLLLPSVDILEELCSFIKKVSEASATARMKPQCHSASKLFHSVDRSLPRAELWCYTFINYKFEYEGEELFKVLQD